MFSSILFLLQACSPTPPLTPDAAQPPSAEDDGSQPLPLPIEEFVRQTFIRGVPYEETSNNYDASDVSALLAMLNDPDEEQHWANIVVVLNIIGDEDVAESLINFINSGITGTYSRPYFSAKMSALLSLGYLINRTESERVLNYLIESLDPKIWEERGTTGISPYETNLEESHMELSKQALLGLAVSGNSTAAEALRLFQASEVSGQQAIFKAKVIGLVPEALKTNEEIANVGLANYYRDN
jgi:hypothetical protein